MLLVLAHSVLENEFGAHSFGGGPLCFSSPFLCGQDISPVNMYANPCGYWISLNQLTLAKSGGLMVTSCVTT